MCLIFNDYLSQIVSIYSLASGETFDLQLNALIFKGVEDIDIFGVLSEEIFMGENVGDPDAVFAFVPRIDMFKHLSSVNLLRGELICFLPIVSSLEFWVWTDFCASILSERKKYLEK